MESLLSFPGTGTMTYRQAKDCSFWGTLASCIVWGIWDNCPAHGLLGNTHAMSKLKAQASPWWPCPQAGLASVTARKTSCWDWPMAPWERQRDGSACKELARQMWGPDLGSLEATENASPRMHVYSTNTGGQGRSLVTQSNWTSLRFGWEALSQNIRWRSAEEEIRSWPLAYTHTHTNNKSDCLFMWICKMCASSGLQLPLPPEGYD